MLGQSEENRTPSHWAESRLVGHCADRVSVHGLSDQAKGSLLFSLWAEAHPWESLSLKRPHGNVGTA